MKTASLVPFVEPKIERPCCVSCKAFAPECLVPVGDGAVPMCWLCAHHVVEHDICVAHAYTGECACRPEDVYPKGVIAKRLRRPTSR